MEFRRLTEQVRDVSNDLKNKLRKSPVEVSRCFLSGSSNFLKFIFQTLVAKYKKNRRDELEDLFHMQLMVKYRPVTATVRTGCWGFEPFSRYLACVGDVCDVLCQQLSARGNN